MEALEDLNIFFQSNYLNLYDTDEDKIRSDPRFSVINNNINQESR